MKRFSWRLTILAAALAACTDSASAQTTNCSGTLAPGTYLNVTVPANTTCVLLDSGIVTVTNNVVVESGATLAFPPSGIMTVTNNVVVESGASLILATKHLAFFVNGSLLGRDAARIELEAQPDSPGKVNILGMVNFQQRKGGGRAGIYADTAGLKAQALIDKIRAEDLSPGCRIYLILLSEHSFHSSHHSEG